MSPFVKLPLLVSLVFVSVPAVVVFWSSAAGRGALRGNVDVRNGISIGNSNRTLQMGAEGGESQVRYVWPSMNGTAARRQLALVEPPVVFVASGYVMQENFVCRDTETKATLDLSLCFTATVPMAPFPPPGQVARLDLIDQTGAAYCTDKVAPRSGFDYSAFGCWPRDKESGEYRRNDIGYDSTIRAKQKEIATLVFELFNFLRIDWFAVSGTVMATVRHMDQIPWDDDIDVHVPYHQLHRLFAFLRQGAPDPEQTNPHPGFEAAAKQWWDWYVATTPKWLRRNAKIRYVAHLAMSLRGARRSERGFIAKVYWRRGEQAHDWPWRHPFIDVFGYEFSEEKTNAATDDEYELVLYDNAVRPATWVFPVSHRPLGHTVVAVPREMPEEGVSVIDNMEFLTECSTGIWNHYYETIRRSSSGPCRLLYDRVPFVTDRQWIYASQAALPQEFFRGGEKNITAMQQEQARYTQLETGGNASATAGLQPLQPVWGSTVTVPSQAFTASHFSRLKQTSAVASTETESAPDIVPAVYERLTIRGVLIAELIYRNDRRSLLPFHSVDFISFQ